MTISLRNQRVRLFELQEQGADGWTKDVYVATADAWARVEPPSGGDLARFEGDDQTISIVATFALSAAIPRKGMIRVLPGGDGESDYRILSTLPRRMLQEQLVYGASMAQDSKPHEVYDASLAACTQIDVQPDGPQHLQVGTQVQLLVTPKDADGNPLSGRTITYSSNSANATVSSTGLVVCVSSGFALITVTVDGNAATGKAFYITAVAARIVVSPSPFTILSGNTQALTVTIYDVNDNVITPAYTLVSGDIAIATVSGNVVTGVAAGEAVIIAQSGAALGGAAGLITVPFNLYGVNVVPVAWWKADSLALANGANVNTWVDSSPSAYVLGSGSVPGGIFDTTAFASGSVDFNGGRWLASAAYAKLNDVAAYTIFYVDDVDSSGGGYIPLTMQNGTGTLTQYLGTYFTVDGVVAASMGGQDAGKHLWEYVYDGSGSTNDAKFRVRKQGAVEALTFTGTVAARTVSGAAGISLGGSYGAHGFAGKIAELIIIPAALTDQQCATIRAALATKYGITVT